METVKIISGGLSVELIRDGDRVCSHYVNDGCFEPDSLLVWQQLVRRGTQALDVGAYTGVFALLASKAGGFPVAIEPMPEMQKRILANAACNNTKIELYRAAASDKNGTAVIQFSSVRMTTGASLDSHPLETKKPISTMLVHTVRIDDLPLGEVSVIKIDAERHELAVLRGARDLIRSQRPALLIEVLNDTALRQVCEELVDYAPSTRIDRRNVLFTPVP